MATQIRYGINYTEYAQDNGLKICASKWFATIEEAQERLEKQSWRNDNKDFPGFWAKIVYKEYLEETYQDFLNRTKN